ncbi:MAG TPA: sugar ABC transporter permease [Micromonosporaceae bacterium]|jgi:multiple sugar transport system permease protein|nr:sugar ABC transporter permease [Micromonosporaceae bacterium]
MSATDASARPGLARPRRRPGVTAPGSSTVTPGQSASRRRRTRRHYLTVTSFMAPALLGIAIFLIFPLGVALNSSLHKFGILDAPGTWFGLGNYRYLFQDPFVRTAAWNTLWFVLVMVPAQILTGLGSAMLLSKFRRSSSFYRTVFYLPAMIPTVAGVLAFVYVLKPGVGPVDTLLGKFGIDGPLWFNSPSWSKPSLVLLSMWGIGNTMVIFLAALLDVPVSLYEAAAIDGANAWQRFRNVTLPTIAPVVLFISITGIIATLSFFTEAAVAAAAASGQATVGGGASGSFGYPQESTLTYPLYLYQAGFPQNLLGYANALAIVLFLVTLAVIAVLLRRSRAFTEGAS